MSKVNIRITVHMFLWKAKQKRKTNIGRTVRKKFCLFSQTFTKSSMALYEQNFKEDFYI